MPDPACPLPVVRRVGALTVTRITETEIAGFAPAALFPDLAGVADDPALFPSQLLNPAGQVRLAVHSWLIRGPQGTMLVDTGIGAGKERPLSPHFHRVSSDFLGQLATAGVRPVDIDHVLLTHLHVDHVGWNTVAIDGVWLPTFPNARYVFSGDEYHFFGDPANFAPRHRNSFLARQDSVDPVVAAGQAMMVPVDGSEALPGIRFLPTPGHSPFHAAILIASEGETALFAGDTLHHVAQVLRPEANSVFDADPAQARSSRLQVLDLAARPGTRLFGAHLAGSSVLTVTRRNEGFAWQDG